MEKNDIKIGNTYLHSNGMKVKVLGITSHYLPIECEWVDSVGIFSCVPGYLSEVTPKAQTKEKGRESSQPHHVEPLIIPKAIEPDRE